MTDNNETQVKTEVRQPDTTYVQEIDGRPYQIRLFFPEDGAETLQEKVERLLQAEMTKIANEGVA